MTAPGWPAHLHEGRVQLRPLRMRDAARWSRLRLENEPWLSPWDGRPPTTEASWAERSSAGAFGVMLRVHRREAKAGRCLPFGVVLDGELVGQVTVNGITWASSRSASVGYWVARTHAGKGITPVAVALVVDHLLDVVGLHRVEISVRPENAPSLKVVEKLGLEEVGLARGYLHIDGGWRDHRVFQVLADEQRGRLLARVTAADGSSSLVEQPPDHPSSSGSTA